MQHCSIHLHTAATTASWCGLSYTTYVHASASYWSSTDSCPEFISSCGFKRTISLWRSWKIFFTCYFSACTFPLFRLQFSGCYFSIHSHLQRPSTQIHTERILTATVGSCFRNEDCWQKMRSIWKRWPSWQCTSVKQCKSLQLSEGTEVSNR